MLIVFFCILIGPFFLAWEAHQVHKVKFAIRREGNADTRMQAIEETLPLKLQLGSMIWSQTFQHAKIPPTSLKKTWGVPQILLNFRQKSDLNQLLFSSVLLVENKFRTSFDDSQKEAHPEMFAEFLGLDSVHRDGHCWYHLLLETTCVWDMWKMRKCCDILGFCWHLMQKTEEPTKVRF